MFTKIKDWVIGGLAVIGSIFGAIFYVLFKQSKAENKLITEKYDTAIKESELKTKELEAKEAQENIRIKREKEREELERKQVDNSDYSNFNGVLNRLQND